MKNHLQLIPATTLVTSLTACGNPIVGEWEGTSINNESFPNESCWEEYNYETYEYGEEVCSTNAFSMIIDSDLTGTFNINQYGSETDATVEVEKESDKYIIELRFEQTIVDLDCSLSTDVLNCGFTVDDVAQTMDFKKATD